jgi:hypothetical protein
MLGPEIGCDDPQDDHREEMNQCVDRLERASRVPIRQNTGNATEW